MNDSTADHAGKYLGRIPPIHSRVGQVEPREGLPTIGPEHLPRDQHDLCFAPHLLLRSSTGDYLGQAPKVQVVHESFDSPIHNVRSQYPPQQ